MCLILHAWRLESGTAPAKTHAFAYRCTYARSLEPHSCMRERQQQAGSAEPQAAGHVGRRAPATTAAAIARSPSRGTTPRRCGLS